MTEYFRLIFISAIICLPAGTILYFLLKKDLIKQPDVVKRSRLINFSKKLIIFSIIIIPSYLLLKFASPITFDKRLYHDKEEYINACINDAKKSNLPDSIKLSYINKSYDYLYNKYGDKIYYADFKYDIHDSIELSLCLYFLTNPNLTDSAKRSIHNELKTKNDLNKFLKEN